MKYLLAGLGAVAVALLLTLPLPQLSVKSPADKEALESPTVLIFGGDMMFDRYIRAVSETVGDDYIFSCIAPLLVEADAVVANLEGPVTTSPSIVGREDREDSSNLTFTFPPQTATLLKRHNISIVNLGNNHTTDFGREGLKQTKQFLNEAGVSFFGLVEKPLLRTDIAAVPFSFIAYNAFSPADNDPIDDMISQEKTEGRVVVVYAHWGDEYAELLPRIKERARRFVNVGADLVVGSHPHIVQEHERYQGRSIYYSLGNFIFDQYFSDAVRNGLLLEVAFNTTGVESIKEIPIVLNPDGRTCVRGI